MRSISLSLMAGTIGAIGTAHAQGYPVKTVRFIITYPTGGGSDYTARPIAQRLTERWGQPVVLESRPGDSAMIGTDFVVKSPADGYTVLFGIDTAFTVNPHIYKTMAFKPGEVREGRMQVVGPDGKPVQHQAVVIAKHRPLAGIGIGALHALPVLQRPELGTRLIAIALGVFFFAALFGSLGFRVLPLLQTFAELDFLQSG